MSDTELKQIISNALTSAKEYSNGGCFSSNKEKAKEAKLVFYRAVDAESALSTLTAKLKAAEEALEASLAGAKVLRTMVHKACLTGAYLPAKDLIETIESTLEAIRSGK